MKKIADYQKALQQSASETAKFMTIQLRNEALASGWTPEVANSLKVVYRNNRLSVSIPKKHRKSADNWEYGTPDRQPTAAIRRFENRLEESEKFLLKTAHKLLGASL